MKLRILIPILGALALLALFLKLPETPDYLHLFNCKKCSSPDPYLPLLAVAYFAALTFTSILFPHFPRRLIAKIGFASSLLLLLATLPNPCIPCLICHGCNILMWGIWLLTPLPTNALSPLREKVCLILIGSLAITTLFGCINLTFLAYSPQTPRSISLRPGDTAPPFPGSDEKKVTFLNFISPSCPYSKMQLTLLHPLLSSSRLLLVTATSSPEMEQAFPGKWIEDPEGLLRTRFKVAGYPTLFMIGTDGKIKQIIPGMRDQLKEDLTALLIDKPQ